MPPAAVKPAHQPSPVSQHQPHATKSSGESEEYLSNPFTNMARGLVLMLKTNPVSTLLLPVIIMLAISAAAVVVFLFAALNPFTLILVAPLFIALIIGLAGASYVIAGFSSRGEVISTSDAILTGFTRMFAYLGLSIVIGFLASIGFMLLIVPGFYFIARAALAPLVLFEEKLGPIQALKRSFELTEGHAAEMLGSLFAAFVMSYGSGGLLTFAGAVAPFVGRYNDLVKLKESNAPKPAVHWLNWLSIFLLGLFVVAYIAYIVALIVVSAHNEAKTQGLDCNGKDLYAAACVDQSRSSSLYGN